MGHHTSLTLHIDSTEAMLLSSLRRMMYRSMQIIGDIVSHAGAVTEARHLSGHMGKHRTALAEAGDAETVVNLSETCFHRIEAVLGAVHDRQTESRRELADTIADIKSAVERLSSDTDPITSTVNEAVERLDMLLHADNLDELKSRLANELHHLRQVAQIRRGQWTETAFGLQAKLQAVETELSGR